MSADDGGRMSSENGTIAILEVYLLWSAQITTLIRSVAAALRSCSFIVRDEPEPEPSSSL